MIQPIGHQHTGFALALLIAAMNPGLSLAAGFVVDVDNHAQPVLGFGAQVWAGESVGQSVLTDLSMDFARVQSGVNWYTYPTQPPTDTNSTAGDNFTAMYNHIANNFNGPNASNPWQLPNIKSTYNHAQANGIDLILNEFQIAHSFLNSTNTRMVTSRVDDYATFLTAQIQYLSDQGVHPKYIEIANEPNGEWNGFITPAQYNTLAQQTRAQLDARGFTDVGIIGPGLNEIGGTRLWNGNPVTAWLDALDTNGVNALAGWSAHTWDDWAGLEGKVQVFNNAIQAADPGGAKPVFITEYATAVSTYGGVDYGSPDAGGTAAEQSEFAVRAFDNTITLINGGASALVLWEAADQSWSNAKWGLRRLNGTERPSFDAFEALLTELPDNATAIDGLGNDGDVSAAAITDGQKLIIAVANLTGQTQPREIQIDNASNLVLDRSVLFASNNVVEPPLSLSGNSLILDIPARSTFTFVLEYTSLVGDLDGDGFVGIGDLNIVLGNWNTNVPAGDLTLGDPDGDGFVGIGDLNLILGNWNTGTAPPPENAIPEPASLLMLAAAGVAVNGVRRRRA